MILSVELFNAGPSDLVVVVPVTRTDRGIRWHVPVRQPEGGLTSLSFIKCEDVRSISKSRLARYRGRVSPRVLGEVEDRIRILLGL